MLKHRTIAITIAALTLSACAPQGSTHPTRFETNPLSFHNSDLESDSLTEQADILSANARAIVRASTLKGAMMGAAVGCGLSVLSASSASTCVKAAAVGAAGGAVIGNIVGKQDVERRIALASPNALVRNLRKANTNLDAITTSLPQVLAQQDAELNRLTLAYAANQISRETHETALHTIRQERANLAEALMITVKEAKLANSNLKHAASQGHSGLDWHIAATEKLARETHSARSTISLL